MGIKLDTQHIFDLGSNLSQQMHELGVTQACELKITVTQQELVKIDEDLFYRREHDKSEVFTPSDNEITINFDNFRIRITNGEN